MERIDDAVIWKRARAGDAEAFGSLFDRHGNAVYGYCFRRTGDWALAEDLTSIVFMEAWRRCAEVELAGGRIFPWLLGVATNVIHNQRRSLRRYGAALKRIPRLEPEHDFADELSGRLDAQEQVRQMLNALRRLPRSQQDALALSASGLSNREVAEALGVREGTVRTRLFRARNRLRKGAASAAEIKHAPSSEGVNTP